MSAAGMLQGRQARVRGPPFALINGATAHDVACIAVPAGVHLDAPVHVLYISTGAAACLPLRALLGRCSLGIAHTGLQTLVACMGPR